MTIGEKIRFMRLLKGLSQEDMAEKLEISLNAFGRIERNETDLNLSRLTQITTVLETSLTELLSIGERTLNYKNTFTNSIVGNPVNAYMNSEHKILNDLEKAEMLVASLQREALMKDEIISHFQKEGLLKDEKITRLQEEALLKNEKIRIL